MPSLKQSKLKLPKLTPSQQLESRRLNIAKLDTEYKVQPNESRVLFVIQSLESFYAVIRGKDGVVTIPVKDIVESALLNKTLNHRPVLEKENILQIKEHLKNSNNDTTELKNYLDYRKGLIKNDKSFKLFDEFVKIEYNSKVKLKSISFDLFDLDFYIKISIKLERIDHVDKEHRTEISKAKGKEQFNQNLDLYKLCKIAILDPKNANIFIKETERIDKAKFQTISYYYRFKNSIGVDKNGQECKYLKIGIDIDGNLRTAYPQINTLKK